MIPLEFYGTLGSFSTNYGEEPKAFLCFYGVN
jgi:hypothetical protein